MKISDIPKDECLFCGGKMCRIKVFELVEEHQGLQEYIHHFNCIKCRRMQNKLKQIDNEIIKLKEEYLNTEYKLFCRKDLENFS